MSSGRTDTSGAAARWLALPVAVALIAAFAGMATAMIGSLAGNRAIYYVAVLAVIGVAGLVAATRPDPLRFVFFALIACFPLVSAEVPPGRLGLTVFNVVTVALTSGLIVRQMLAPAAAGGPLFPTKSLLVASLLCIPCIAFSQFPLLSLQIFVLNFSINVLFLLALEEFER